jgi:hypothetical protein
MGERILCTFALRDEDEKSTFRVLCLEKRFLKDFLH